MIPTVTNRVVLIVTLCVAVVGVIDAGIGRSYDLVAVFGLIAVLQVLLLARLSSRRPCIPIRADLVAWARDRAAVEADAAELIVDRALASYKMELLGAQETDGEPAARS